MARVTCPECDTRTRIPDDHDRSYIRCKECEKKIYLDDDEEEEYERPRKPRGRTLSKIKKPRRGETDNGIVSFWPLLLIFPLLVLPGLAYLHRVGAIMGIGGGIVMALTGFIMAWIAASSAGIGTVGDLPFVLQRIPLVHLFYQIKYAIELPKEAGMWVLLEFLGIGVAIISGILIGRHDQPPNRHVQVPYFDAVSSHLLAARVETRPEATRVRMARSTAALQVSPANRLDEIGPTPSAADLQVAVWESPPNIQLGGTS